MPPPKASQPPLLLSLLSLSPIRTSDLGSHSSADEDSQGEPALRKGFAMMDGVYSKHGKNTRRPYRSRNPRSHARQLAESQGSYRPARLQNRTSPPLPRQS